MIVERWTDPSWLSNAWLLADRAGGEGLIVDTGAPVEPITEAVRGLGVTVRWIVNTHHHHDHVAGNKALRTALGAPIAAHELEAARMIGGADRLLRDGDRLDAGGLRARILHIPGHTTGQIAIAVRPPPEEDAGPEFVLTGDTLFRRSIGGTVGPGHGTFAELRASLLDRLLTLPPDTIVLPGHGEATTIAEERNENPFVRVLEGVDAPGDGSCLYAGLPARLLVWAHDYDGGHKAMVRFPDGTEAVVPGSRVTGVRSGDEMP
jgi:glyoxylase-like metal-dependent hydrolase (beta-lactamase superfamily II)